MDDYRATLMVYKRKLDAFEGLLEATKLAHDALKNSDWYWNSGTMLYISGAISKAERREIT